jgi:hypothetical protein
MVKVLEGIDWMTVHVFLSFFAGTLALYVMGLTGYVHEDAADPYWVQWLRRIGLGGLSLSLLWSVNYSQTNMWQPWPPDLALIFALIVILTVRVIGIHSRIWRETHHILPRPRSKIDRSSGRVLGN